MPNKLATPCLYQSCSALVTSKSGYCPQHQKDSAKNRENEMTAAEKEARSFYYSKAWRRLRQWHLTRYPLCVVCGRIGRVVDHIVPIRLGGAELDETNLQTMCDTHHNEKRAQERHVYVKRDKT